MKGADTWMAFYVGDYVANTLHLTTRQHGAYLLLILAAWKNGGWIKAASAQAITKLSNKEWQRDRDTLADFFEVNDERWAHIRVSEEWETARQLSDERSKAGANGAAKRWRGHSKLIANASQNYAPSPSQETTNVVSPRKSRKTRLPADWKPTEAELAYAAEQGCPDPARTAEDFRIHHVGAGTLWGDWHLAFLKWCRNEKNFARAPRPVASGGAGSVTTQHDTADQWRARMRGYKPGALWNVGDWGPRPETGASRVPQSILSECGFTYDLSPENFAPGESFKMVSVPMPKLRKIAG